MSTSTHCPTCAAPIREADARYCRLCGTERPKSEQPFAPLAPNAKERFEAAERHPSLQEFLGHSPSTAGHMTSNLFVIGFLLVFCAAGSVIGAVFFAMGWTDDEDLGRLFSIAPIVLVGVGLALLIYQVTRAAKYYSAKLVRAIALVVDKRAQVSGDEVPSTTYFASLETKDRKRREYRVDFKLAGKIAVHDLGMAYTKGDALLDFKRLET